MKSGLRFLLFVLSLTGSIYAQNPEKQAAEVPPVDVGAQALSNRRTAQFETIQKFNVFYDFQFTDRLSETGISFIHRIVDDAGKRYKPIHYDHGNGIAVADVDQDGLLDVYFTTQLGSNELWRNLGKGKFENITQRSGVGMKDKISVTASFADFDNDGDQDLYVTTVRKGNSLFQNDGKGNFQDVTKERGLTYSGHSSGAVFFDFDRDGWLDLFLTNVGKYTTNETGRGGYYVGIQDAFSGHLKPELNETNILYRNLEGKKFVDVSEKTGIRDETWSGDASVADLNEDGYPDLYVLNMQGDNRFYENVKGEKFIDKTAQYFPKTPWGAMGIKFFDYNRDGKLDLLLTDMHSDMSEEIKPDAEKSKSNMRWSDHMLQGGSNNIFGNAFYKNLGGGKFQEASDELGLENYWPWGVSVDDINADGFDDVLITSSMNFPFRYGINSLLLNNKAKNFLDSEFILGIEPRRGGHTKTHWFDLDCGGADKGNQMCGPQTIAFPVLGTLGTRSAVIFDVEEDGDLDIITNDFNSQPMVLLSNLSNRKPIQYVQIELVGKKSNRNGLGAVVKVVAGGATQTKSNDGKSGYLSQSVYPLYFGLGNEKEIEKIEVLWPSGIRQVIDKPAINKTLKIEEPEK